eukprot:scaffold11748_cov29-Tisochrysis_lutea.AAC.3
MRKKNFLLISPQARPCTSSSQPRPRPFSLLPSALRLVPSCATSGLSVRGFKWQTVCSGAPGGLVLPYLLRHRATGFLVWTSLLSAVLGHFCAFIPSAPGVLVDPRLR